jgi:hypothetical protein
MRGGRGEDGRGGERWEEKRGIEGGVKGKCRMVREWMKRSKIVEELSC